MAMMQPFDDGDKPTTEHRESYGKDDQAFTDRSIDGAKVVDEQEIVQSELAEVLLREKTGEYYLCRIGWAPLTLRMQTHGHHI
jgi:hypothetical protein